jgi:hypothetical protein
MTIILANPAPRASSLAQGWFGRFTARARARRDERFTPVAALPPHLLRDIGLAPDSIGTGRF